MMSQPSRLLLTWHVFPDRFFLSLQLDPEAPLSSALLLSLPPFAPVALNDPHSDTPTSGAPEIAKTGLGSSAAMVTAVVAAVLHHLQAVDLAQPSQDSLRVIHTVAQAAHCSAQGKVGSGFDVSAAVYGSQRYVRFSPACLATPTVRSFSSSIRVSAGYTQPELILEGRMLLCAVKR